MKTILRDQPGAGRPALAVRSSGGQASQREPERVATIIIGGGQAGLAVGYYLAKRDMEFVILDASGRVGDSWRKRWDTLRVFTPARYDGLPGMRFPAPPHSYPTKDEIADYLEAYATRMNLPVRHGIQVERLARMADEYLVVAGDRSYLARHVVVATGAYHHPKVPDFAADLDPGIRQLHSSEYRNPSQLQPGDVLVVGASNSGAEVAHSVATAHHTWLSGRDTGHLPVHIESRAAQGLTYIIWFVFNHVLTVATPLGRRVLPYFRLHGTPLERVRPADLAAVGVERVFARTVGVRDGQPMLEDGRVVEITNVIWCTGFRRDFGWIELPVAGEDGWPHQERGVVPTAPGLYFVGLPFLYSAASSLIGGVGRDAAYIANQVALRAASTRRRKPADRC